MEEVRSINIDFFETYIHLDDLCRERLGFSASDYINRMTNTPPYEQVLVSNWEKNYKKFRHMRHLRNELAHGLNAFDAEMCTKSDISWLKSMCFRIERQTDPLTLLYIRRAQKPIFEKDEDKDYIKINWKKVIIASAAVAGVTIAVITASIRKKSKK